jgi:putative oxidoreductase
MPVIIQILVAWGEFSCGAAILLGFLTEIAAAGIIIIMIGAIVLVHAKNGFGMMNGGFEYNFALIMMCLTLIGTGPGPFTIGSGTCCKRE